jgi:hypothetical protein
MFHNVPLVFSLKIHHTPFAESDLEIAFADGAARADVFHHE